MIVKPKSPSHGSGLLEEDSVDDILLNPDSSLGRQTDRDPDAGQRSGQRLWTQSVKRALPLGRQCLAHSRSRVRRSDIFCDYLVGQDDRRSAGFEAGLQAFSPLAHTSARTPWTQARGDTGPVQMGRAVESVDGQPSRGVSRNRKSGRPRVSGVRPDRFDYEVEFVGAVDFARYAVSHLGLDEMGF
jgi:hypothetical protein